MTKEKGSTVSTQYTWMTCKATALTEAGTLWFCPDSIVSQCLHPNLTWIAFWFIANCASIVTQYYRDFLFIHKEKQKLNKSYTCRYNKIKIIVWECLPFSHFCCCRLFFPKKDMTLHCCFCPTLKNIYTNTFQFWGEKRSRYCYKSIYFPTPTSYNDCQFAGMIVYAFIVLWCSNDRKGIANQA